MSQRKINYLNRKKIIYRRDPTTDKPTQVFNWGYYYENGTYQCYDLFKSKAKINTYRSLKWHLLVLWYLNPEFNENDFENLCKFIVDIKNEFITFTVSASSLDKIMYEVSMCDLEKPPNNKLRKVIFKDQTGLTITEKLKIVGSIIGKSKKIHKDDIYLCMLDINELGEKITISKLAQVLKCSSRTIHRNIGNELKKEKELLNKQNEKV
tara:strand:- start:1098 stop:1724 length:627 start_codon:yes stop_codon:yes gene_type:complete